MHAPHLGLARRLGNAWRVPLLGALLCVILSGQWPHAYGQLDFDEQQVRQNIPRQYGVAGVRNAEKWLDWLKQIQGVPESQLLSLVNNYWNTHVMAAEDMDIWGREDYWATPLESLVRQAGDCEDYVIGKYFSLLHAGVPAEKLRLIYVRAQMGAGSIAHMVLGYYSAPDAEPLLLDNLTGSIRPASQRPDLRPVFSFNSQGVYVAGAPTRSVDGIGHWRGLLEKMRKEGFRP